MSSHILCEARFRHEVTSSARMALWAPLLPTPRGPARRSRPALTTSWALGPAGEARGPSLGSLGQTKATPTSDSLLSSPHTGYPPGDSPQRVFPARGSRAQFWHPRNCRQCPREGRAAPGAWHPARNGHRWGLGVRAETTVVLGLASHARGRSLPATWPLSVLQPLGLPRQTMSSVPSSQDAACVYTAKPFRYAEIIPPHCRHRPRAFGLSGPRGQAEEAMVPGAYL